MHKLEPLLICISTSHQKLSRYNFRLLDSVGWNFRHAHFHEEGRRTLYKAYGIKFVIIVQGRAGEIKLGKVHPFFSTNDD